MKRITELNASEIIDLLALALGTLPNTVELRSSPAEQDGPHHTPARIWAVVTVEAPAVHPPNQPAA